VPAIICGGDKKMKWKILAVLIAVILIASIVTPTSAAIVTQPTDMNQWNVHNIWNAILNLQSQINHIQPTPGPRGPTGPPGPAGATGPTGPAGATTHFGDWDTTSYVKAVKYTAATDGFVVVTGVCPGVESCSMKGIAKFDSIGDPVPALTFVVDIQSYAQETLTMPVKAGDKWGVYPVAPPVPTMTIRWIPLTS
jgi:hypothetical protein